MPTEMSVRELYALTKEGTQLEKDQLEYVQLQGWIRTNRAGKNVSFIALNDGTYLLNAQTAPTPTLRPPTAPSSQPTTGCTRPWASSWV